MEGLPQEQKESLERGKNVEIVLKFLRHGERDKEGRLTDYGRSVTAERARESGIKPDDFDAVKAIGSNAGEKAGVGKRAFETADIYAHTIAGDGAFNSRVEKVLSFEGLKNSVPYDHVEIYNASLPENFNSLSNEEKAVAAKKAQAAVIDHLINLDTPEADAYRDEMAGAFAYLIEHYRKMTKKLKSGSKVLLPAGTHGGVMEFLLQKALVRTDKDGNEVIGFKNSKEIGGEFSPSEAYNVDIVTDENGDYKPLMVSFDTKSRGMDGKLYLDENKIKELAEFYESLHSEPNGL